MSIADPGPSSFDAAAVSSFLCALTARFPRPAITTTAALGATLLRLMRKIIVDRVAASDDLLSLTVTENGATTGETIAAMIISCAGKELASLDLLTGDLRVTVEGSDARAIAMMGWGCSVETGSSEENLGPVRVMLVSAATTAEEVLVLSQLVEAAVYRVGR